MSFVTAFPPQTSGVPLGGLGTGSIELRPDGEFHAWQIANPLIFRQDCRKHPDADDGESLTGSLSFCLRTESKGCVLLRHLGFGADDNNYRMYSFLKPVSAIEYSGTFPTVALSYRDPALPIEITLEAAAPFVPYDENTSGTPGIFLTFSLHNRSEAPVSVSLCGKLKSIVSAGSDGYGRRCRVLRHSGFTGICTESASKTEDAPNQGSLVLSAAGNDTTVLSGEYSAYMNEYVAHGLLGVSEESYIFDLYRTGHLPDIEQYRQLDPRLLSSDADSLSEDEMQRLWNSFCKRACVASIMERLLHDADNKISDPAFFREMIRYLIKNLREIDSQGWGDSAVCVQETLEPEETVQIPFVLSWYFPMLYSASGAFIGHRYAERFSDAVEVNDYLWKNRELILKKVHHFCSTLYDCSFSSSFPDAVSIHLSTLVKSSWWSKSGDFGIWEGLGSCGLHTTDISYHATFGLCSLYPRLQQKQMQQTVAMMRQDGAVPHFFTPDFSSVDNGFDRVDLNPQFVLLVCRDWLAIGDQAELRSVFPKVCAAMEYTLKLDRNGDGLPDSMTQRNTYDAWQFSGTSVYLSVLWLAALKAAARMADDLGEAAYAGKWRAILRQGTDTVIRLLWNGSYFDLWNDGMQRDESCMTDQLDGELFCRLIGLGGIFDDTVVCQTLNTIYYTNFTPERGLINAGYFPGKQTTMYTFRNCQGEANWSGIEYWFAVFLLLSGDYDRGLQLVETVQERYLRLGKIWNHAECGDFYYRPLSSFALLSALTGFTFDAPLQALRFGPGAKSSFSAPWFTPFAYGMLHATQGSHQLSVRSGSLTLAKIILPKNADVSSIRVEERELSYTTERSGNALIVLFSPVVLCEGETITVAGSAFR